MTKDETVSLVNEASQLERRINADTDRLKELKGQLVKLAPGTYPGDAGAKAEVIQPKPGIRPGAYAIAKAMELAGDLAKKLFSRTVVIKPVKEFRAAARAALTPAKAEKVIAICEVDAAPYVVIS